MTSFSKYLTKNEEQQLFRGIYKIDNILAKRDYYWMLLMRETAVRFSVLFGVDDRKAKKLGIELKGLTISEAAQSVDIGTLVYRAETNKRGKVVEIYLTESARLALRKLIQIHKTMSQQWTWDIPLEERPLILGQRHCHGMSRRSAQARLAHWSQLFLNFKISPHWLRHTWAKSYFDNSTAPDKALRRIQAVLGHSNISTTSIYTQPSKEDIQKAMHEGSSCRK